MLINCTQLSVLNVKWLTCKIKNIANHQHAGQQSRHHVPEIGTTSCCIFVLTTPPPIFIALPFYCCSRPSTVAQWTLALHTNSTRNTLVQVITDTRYTLLTLLCELSRDSGRLDDFNEF